MHMIYLKKTWFLCCRRGLNQNDLLLSLDATFMRYLLSFVKSQNVCHTYSSCAQSDVDLQWILMKCVIACSYDINAFEWNNFNYSCVNRLHLWNVWHVRKRTYFWACYKEAILMTNSHKILQGWICSVIIVLTNENDAKNIVHTFGLHQNWNHNQQHRSHKTISRNGIHSHSRVTAPGYCFDSVKMWVVSRKKAESKWKSV